MIRKRTKEALRVLFDRVMRPAGEGARAFVLAAVLLQLVLFLIFAWKGQGQWLYSDHILYEKPAWALAQGYGLAFHRADWEDPYLTRLYHAAHPEQASSDWVPAVTFPPGYSIFLGLVYWFCGRNLSAAVAANGLLLLASIPLALVLVRQLSGDRRVGAIAAVLVALWPQPALWAARVTTDTLHMTLILAFGVVWFRSGRSMSAAWVSAALLAAATMVRPYAIAVPLLLGGLAALRRERREVVHAAILALAVWGAVGAWAARNYNHFEKPIVLTSMGPGIALYVTSYEYVEGKRPGWEQIYSDWRRIGVESPYRVEDHTRLMAAVTERIRAHPMGYARACARNLVRLWLPGWEGAGVSPAGLLWMIWTALLAVTALVGWGIVARRKAWPAAGALGLVLYYSLVFIPFAAEGRYLLPIRALGFWLSAVALDGTRTWLRDRAIRVGK